MEIIMVIRSIKQYAFSVLFMIPCAIFAGYSPVTSLSSDDPHPDPGADSSKWYRYHHLTPRDEFEAADPTYSLEDDTQRPNANEVYSDTLMPVIW